MYFNSKIQGKGKAKSLLINAGNVTVKKEHEKNKFEAEVEKAAKIKMDDVNGEEGEDCDKITYDTFISPTEDDKQAKIDQLEKENDFQNTKQTNMVKFVEQFGVKMYKDFQGSEVEKKQHLNY